MPSICDNQCILEINIVYNFLWELNAPLSALEERLSTARRIKTIRLLPICDKFHFHFIAGRTKNYIRSVETGFHFRIVQWLHVPIWNRSLRILHDSAMHVIIITSEMTDSCSTYIFRDAGNSANGCHENAEFQECSINAHGSLMNVLNA